MHQHGSTYIARRHTLDPGVESKGHVAYQIKEMEHRAQFNHIFCPYTLDPGGRVKRSEHCFSKSRHVAYHLKGMLGA